MDKGRRQELTKLKFKKRLNNLGLLKNGKPTEGKLYAFKSHGSPCSCFVCQPKGKYRDNRPKNNKTLE